MEWITSSAPVAYPDATAWMEERVAAIRSGVADEAVWLLEHPPLYTAGTSARVQDLLEQARFPVYTTGRGGEWTYHGPGQRVAYILLDLKRRAGEGAPDIRRFVQDLERWIILALAHFGVRGEVRAGRIGVWVNNAQGGEAKIAALGIRVRKGVSYHGIAINVSPDLTHFSGIVPCGIRDYGVTSLAALGVAAPMEAVDAALQQCFAAVFGEGG